MNSDINENFDWQNVKVTPDGKYLRSSFPGLWKPSAERGNHSLSPSEWLQGKRELDDVGDYWRVYNKLYNLESFIQKHPGGSDWIEMTRGTDITEAFEASHVVNVNKVEAVLAKYYVKDAEHPRNSPYTFKEDGFYKTLKRRVEPVFKKHGVSPTQRILWTQDILAIGFITLSILAAWSENFVLTIVAGLFLGLSTTAAHNSFHLRDSFRKYYFDLSAWSSYEWRISHALSHHLFPNTILDYEIAVFEPWLEMLPSRPKTFFQRYGSLVYAHLIYCVMMPQDCVRRAHLWYLGKTKPRPENFIILLELLTYIYFAPSVWAGVRCWLIVLAVASYWVGLVGINAAHHHPDCFHDGDDPRQDPDFGLCQLDATIEKAEEIHKTEFAILTTFGEHPLHHLFPAVCHSKLHLVKPIFEKTLEEFLGRNRSLSQLELFIGTHKQLARMTPNKGQ
ncbi:unnamed protein product [Orchesella dallaii]|uniref:Cytochrome b5 heme-binding domain-containing protein n=1 Tax=Orchesella dallaii TaxID=48710 RepID=A0ABP1QB57_9HEXA